MGVKKKAANRDMTVIVNYLLKSEILCKMGAILQDPSQEKGWQNQLKILVPLP
jgi:hypothetical protein